VAHRAIERNTVAGKYGDAVRVPEAVLEAARAVREGRTTAERANRTLRTAPGRSPRPTGTPDRDDARRKALRGARERLRRFREGE
jgi:alkanesulfonate monooxygenase SsuD/methylene tetrahydromethanopterin reductase-like flavin-dependent oxidoreductase (luciferase family)